MKAHWITVIDTLTDQYVYKCNNCGEDCCVEYVRCPCCNTEMDNGVVEYKENHNESSN